MQEIQIPPEEVAPPGAELSVLLIGLLKGVQYRQQDERQWARLLDLQARVRDYVAVLNLDLVLDEAEGYAFLKARAESAADGAAPALPRLMARRPLSFPVSLLLALLRKKLAESDAGGSDPRLVLSRDEIVELIRVFLPDDSNEARLIDRVDATINKVLELGFLHKLKSAQGTVGASYEVRRILKAFVDAQWLAEFEARLAGYRAALADDASDSGERDE
ncbi:DUF4194 domain-containing protein [Castellaniella caeni]|uniref:DUF4194 domain-containing protein n=1 Tax=Castellaniella caeni TaxID=266123 RepID=UPI00082BC85F|nr:DUF4194 domain-containing protein [Castellaniella caeni]